MDDDTAVVLALATRRWDSLEKHFQNRSVSSPAAETTVWPSGDMAKCNTRDVCPVYLYTNQRQVNIMGVAKGALSIVHIPVNSAILAIEGYFQTQSWFCEKPWLDTISLWVLDHNNEQTCDLVSIVLRHVPV